MLEIVFSDPDPDILIHTIHRILEEMKGSVALYRNDVTVSRIQTCANGYEMSLYFKNVPINDTMLVDARGGSYDPDDI